MANRIRFEIKPAPSVSFDIGVLEPGSHDPQNQTVYACGPEDHGELDDYATLFAGAFVGDQRHFAHIDGIVEAWRILAPIRDAGIDVEPYAPGSDGPEGWNNDAR
jgi:glucose-6-phosphate 1-dehydrogenase